MPNPFDLHDYDAWPENHWHALYSVDAEAYYYHKMLHRLGTFTQEMHQQFAEDPDTREEAAYAEYQNQTAWLEKVPGMDRYSGPTHAPVPSPDDGEAMQGRAQGPDAANGVDGASYAAEHQQQQKQHDGLEWHGSGEQHAADALDGAAAMPPQLQHVSNGNAAGDGVDNGATLASAGAHGLGDDSPYDPEKVGYVAAAEHSPGAAAQLLTSAQYEAPQQGAYAAEQQGQHPVGDSFGDGQSPSHGARGAAAHHVHAVPDDPFAADATPPLRLADAEQAAQSSVAAAAGAASDQRSSRVAFLDFPQTLRGPEPPADATLAGTTSNAHVRAEEDAWIDPDELDFGDQPPAAQQWAQWMRQRADELPPESAASETPSEVRIAPLRKRLFDVCALCCSLDSEL